MEAKQYVRSAKATANGKLTGTFNARLTGTQAMVTMATLQAGNGKSVNIDLIFEDTRLYPPDVGITKVGPLGALFVHGVRPRLDVGDAVVKDSDGKEFQVCEFVTHTLKTKLKIPDGQAVLVKEIKTGTWSPGVKRGQQNAYAPQIMLIVSARIKKQNAKED
jgi:hypothetical protein